MDRRVAKEGLVPAQTHDLSDASHDSRRQVHRWHPAGSTTSTRASRRTCTSRRSRAAPTCAAASSVGNPTLPVWRGRDPGRRRSAWTFGSDADGSTAARRDGRAGLPTAFPSMPSAFWGDDGGRALRSAYFERFPGVWHHGDFARTTEHGGVRDPRAVRRHAQSRWRTDRDRGDLPAGRRMSRGARVSR